MTTTEPNAGDTQRGRHAKSHDPDREAEAADEEREPAHAETDDGEPHGSSRAEVADDEPADDEPEASATEDESDGPPADHDEENSAEEETAEHDAPAEGDEPSDDEEPAEDDEPEDDDEKSGADEDTAADEETAEEEDTAAEEAEAAPPPQDRRPEKTRDERPERRSALHAVAHHPAGSSLLTSAGLITGLALVTVLLDQLHFEVATRAAEAARSAAPPWPAGEPWFWPGWVAILATVVALVVIVVAALGVLLPDLAILGTAVVLAVATARASWATIDVLNSHLWELIPVCLVCLGAFGSAVAAAFRWRSKESAATGAGTGEVAGVTLGAWLLVLLLFLGGSAIASSAQTHAFGNVTSPPQNLAGLLSVRAADAPKVDDLRGHWAAQVGAAQVMDDAAASAYAVAHHGLTSRFPTLLARGDDIGVAGLDDTWWVSLTAQGFGSQQDAAAWCSSSGVSGCTPRKIGG